MIRTHGLKAFRFEVHRLGSSTESGTTPSCVTASAARYFVTTTFCILGVGSDDLVAFLRQRAPSIAYSHQDCTGLPALLYRERRLLQW